MGLKNVAFLFPGQGSQAVGMLADLAEAYPVVSSTFSEASDALGIDLWALCQAGPAETLNQTENTQPAMLAAGIATWRAWQAAGGQAPERMAGHSLGEYSALVAAEAMMFEDAVRLVRLRGQLMQKAVPEGQGAMAAIIGMDDSDLEAVCEQVSNGDVVSCANYNAPGQVVIAGERDAVQRACDAALEGGARRALPLPVSVPSHCALMRGAADELRDALSGIQINSPGIPVTHNADVGEHSEPDKIRDILARQLWQPVRWTKTIQHLASAGVTNCVESGPGKVLTGLNRRIDRGLGAQALIDPTTMNKALEELQS